MSTIDQTRIDKTVSDAERAVEIERLRAQNAMLQQSIATANAAMTSAPGWHEMHRSAHKALQAAMVALDALERQQRN